MISFFSLSPSDIFSSLVPGSHRLYIFRLATASTVSVQLSMAFRKQIQRWVVTIHKTARDDRYLIGEVLLNFQPEGADM